MRLTSAVLMLVLAGCGLQSTRAQAPCPCADGWRCCEATGRCVPPDDTQCPAAMRVDSVTPTEGPLGGGTRLHITGAQLPEGLEVFVGVRPCGDVRRVDEGDVSCTTPPGPTGQTHLPVRVVAPAGSVAELPTAFRYLLPAFDAAPVPSLAEAPWRGQGLAIADFDGDEVLDIFFTRAEATEPVGAGTLYRNLGGLAFEDLTRMDWDALLRGSRNIAVADFNYDGVKDVFLGLVDDDEEDAQLVALIGEPELGFTLSAVEDRIPARLEDLRALHLNVDPGPDLIACRVPLEQPDEGPELPADPMLRVLLSDDMGTGIDDSFVHFDLDRIAERGPCRALASGDVDLDGDIDVIVGGRWITLLENTGDALVDASEAWGLPAAMADSMLSMELVDVDADGRLDLVATAAPSLVSGLWIWRNEGGHFTRLPALEEHWTPAGLVSYPIPAPSLRLGHDSVIWLDADHDGDLDLFMPQARGDEPIEPVLHRSALADTGTLSFSAERLPFEGIFVRHQGVASGDLDGDGDLDLVVTSWTRTPNRREIIRNGLMENSGSAQGPAGHWLSVLPMHGRNGREQPALGVLVELDLDGPEDAPDFAPGRGALRVATAGGGRRSSQDAPAAHFGLGPLDPSAPLPWLRVRFPDGSVLQRQVPGLDQALVVYDCAEAQCL